MPPTLLLGRTEVAELLIIDGCLAAVESAFRARVASQILGWHEVTRCLSNKPTEEE